MKKFRLVEYNRIFNLSGFQGFIDWYEQKTGDLFSTKYNKTQPNNRLHLQKFPADGSLKVVDLQGFLRRNMTPVPGSISSESSNKIIENLYSRDYDMHLLSS